VGNDFQARSRVINPDVIAYADTIRWGAAIDGTVSIWRSGTGMTKGRRWLLYAAGNSLSAETLTAALEAAGASDAMQLDVNATFERFVPFARKTAGPSGATPSAGSPVVSVRLINKMKGGPDQFLKPCDRDFFYLTYADSPQNRTLGIDLPSAIR
jgi:hypothetical protein